MSEVEDGLVGDWVVRVVPVVCAGSGAPQRREGDDGMSVAFWNGRRLMQSADPDIESGGGLLRVGTPNKASTDLEATLVQQIAEAIHRARTDSSPICDDEDDLESCWPPARAVLPLVEAQVAPLRESLDIEIGLHEEMTARWRAAESALRQVRELADEWDRTTVPARNAFRVAAVELRERLACERHEAMQDEETGQFMCTRCGLTNPEAVGAMRKMGDEPDTPEEVEPCVCGTGFTCMARHETGGE